MLTMVRECGVTAWPILLVGMMACVAGVAAAILAVARSPGTKSVAVAALVLGLAASGLGVVGMMLGRAASDNALAGAAPASRDELRAVGHAEAQQCLMLGGGGGALPLVLGAIALALAAGRDRQSP